MDSDILAPDSAVVTEGFINSADGTKLAYRAWPLSGAKITFAVVHGLGEHSGRYERFARGMAEPAVEFAVDYQAAADTGKSSDSAREYAQKKKLSQS